MSNHNECLLSVIVPVYNACQYIGKCLNSILSQKLMNIEVIVIDDGSVDGSLDIIAEFSKQDARIRFFHQVNAGVSSARNLGLAQAKGDYITFVDADDYVDSTAYVYILDLLAKEHADICIYAFLREYKGQRITVDLLPWEEGAVLDKKQIREDLIPLLIAAPRNKKSISGSVCRSVFKRDILDKIKFNVKVNIQEDLLYCIAAYARAEKIVITNRNVYHYVKHGNTTTERYRQGYYQESLQFEECIVEALQEIDLFDAVRERYWSKRLTMYSLCVSNLFREDAPWKVTNELQEILEGFSQDKYIHMGIYPEYLNVRKFIIYAVLKTKMPVFIMLVYKLKEIKRRRNLSA